MAANFTLKAVDVCRQLSRGANDFMAALEALETVGELVADSGLDITTPAINAALELEADLKHAVPADYQAVQASVSAIRTFLNANNHNDVLQKVRF